MLQACKKCRREGAKLMLKGDKCLSPKCTFIKRAYAPGQHGQSFHGKVSEYGKQLREKQSTRRSYGISESQFSNIVKKAEKLEGNTAENLMKLLELRLDNVVYRLGFATSRSWARQLVSHGHISVNGKKLNIPSATLDQNDTIEPKNKDNYKEIKSVGIPTWLELDIKKVSGRVKQLPKREEIDTPVNESLIIEFYSR
jgi:small subunit ribosomal protein S4